MLVLLTVFCLGNAVALVVIYKRLSFSFGVQRDHLAWIERKENSSNKARISGAVALEKLVSNRCVDMAKHIETYQDINKKKLDGLEKRFVDNHKKVNERIDNLATGCIQTNGRLDKWVKDLRNRIDVLQLESVGVTVPARDLNADEVSA